MWISDEFNRDTYCRRCSCRSLVSNEARWIRHVVEFHIPSIPSTKRNQNAKKNEDETHSINLNPVHVGFHVNLPPHTRSGWYTISRKWLHKVGRQFAHNVRPVSRRYRLCMIVGSRMLRCRCSSNGNRHTRPEPPSWRSEHSENLQSENR